MTEALLSVQGLSKSFYGFTAVDQAGFDLAGGDSLGIIGPNGSGKTTLVNLITGFVKPKSGRVLFQGEPITGLAPYRIAQKGLARTFQTARPYYRLPAFKNVVVPLFSKRLRRLPGGRYGGRRNTALDLLEEVGFEREAAAAFKTARSLPHGHLKRLELARCLALRPDLIVMDEIFSGLSLAEVGGLLPIIANLQKKGVSVIMIEHRLRELFRVMDRILVMNFGRIIADGTPGEVMADEGVKAAYLGAE